MQVYSTSILATLPYIQHTMYKRTANGVKTTNCKSCTSLLILLYIHVFHLLLHKCIYVYKTIYMFIKDLFINMSFIYVTFEKQTAGQFCL